VAEGRSRRRSAAWATASIRGIRLGGNAAPPRKNTAATQRGVTLVRARVTPRNIIEIGKRGPGSQSTSGAVTGCWARASSDCCPDTPNTSS